MVLPGGSGLSLLGDGGEEVEEEGVVVGLDVVVDGGNPVDLEGRRKERREEVSVASRSRR